MTYRSRFAALCGIALCALIPSFAQSLPSNASLQGAYYVRYLGVNGAANNCDCPVSFSGVVTFDGKGGFSLTSGQGVTNNGSDHALVTLNTGTYTVWSNGEVSLTNPFDSTNNTTLYGGVGQGAIVASSTDTGYVDLFIAIPVATGATNATLNGTYQVADLEFFQGNFNNSRNNLFTVTADGSGNLANISVTGTSINLKDVKTTQSISGATYTVTANGTGTLNLPAPTGVSTATSQLIAGNKILYVSQDGSFFIAGSQSGYDIIVGTKAPAATTKVNFSGLYFTAELDNFNNGGSFAGLYGTEGSSNLLGDAAGNELVHQRINPDGYDSYDETYSDTFTFNSSGVNTGSSSYALAISANGNVAFVIGQGGDYYLQVYVKAPTIVAPTAGPFLNPQGVVNAATNSPFTAQISPGEVITLYGNGFSTSNTLASAPFPNTLGGAQVFLNGNAVPIYFVSPGQISAVVPYDTTSTNAVVTVQVSSGGTKSNIVNTYLGLTSPGVFTVPPGGIGDGAILHPDFSLVKAGSPAKAGEAIAIFLTGLGAVNESVAAGAPAPGSSTLVNPIDVAIGGVAAKVQYAGLAPGLGGLYQVNVIVPAGVHGDVTLEISTVDGDNIQATVPIQ